MAWDFDGVDDNITIADTAVLTLPTEFTCGGWVRHGDWGAVSGPFYVMSWGAFGANPSSNFYMFGGTHSSLANRCAWRVRGLGVNPTDTTPGSDTEWQHFILGRNSSGTAILYRNGVSLGSLGISGTIDIAESLFIGRLSTGGALFSGQMGEWFKINRLVSSLERDALASGMSPIDLPGIHDATSWYMPMYGDAYVDVKDRIALTVNGSPVAAKHPPVRMPFARRQTRRIVADPIVPPSFSPSWVHATHLVGGAIA